MIKRRLFSTSSEAQGNIDYLIQEDETAAITLYKGDSDKLVIPI